MVCDLGFGFGQLGLRGPGFRGLSFRGGFLGREIYADQRGIDQFLNWLILVSRLWCWF